MKDTRAVAKARARAHTLLRHFVVAVMETFSSPAEKVFAAIYSEWQQVVCGGE